MTAKNPRSQTTRFDMDFYPMLGAVLVVVILLSIAITAIDKWPPVLAFLNSSAASWVQAIGSVAAIYAAIHVVSRQHEMEVQRRRDFENKDLRRRTRSMRTVFFSAAKTCESIARDIDSRNGPWEVASTRVKDARQRLLSIDPLLIPDARLLFLVEESASKLYFMGVVLENLNSHRVDEVFSAAKTGLMGAARTCWLGLYEATRIEAGLMTGTYNDTDLNAFDGFDESLRKLDKLRAQHEKDMVNRATEEGDSSFNDAQSAQTEK